MRGGTQVENLCYDAVAATTAALPGRGNRGVPRDGRGCGGTQVENLCYSAVAATTAALPVRGNLGLPRDGLSSRGHGWPGCAIL